MFPPSVPNERVEIMREAIAKAARDPELIAEAEKMKLDMAYRPPEHLERLIANLYRTSPAIVEAVKKLVPNFDQPRAGPRTPVIFSDVPPSWILCLLRAHVPEQLP